MPEYMVRVEIFKADSEDYEDMHKALELIGLKKTVLGDNGLHRLPPGTYFGESHLETHDLRERVRIIAEPYSHPFDPSIFVCQSNGWSSWLRPA